MIRNCAAALYGLILAISVDAREADAKEDVLELDYFATIHAVWNAEQTLGNNLWVSVAKNGRIDGPFLQGKVTDPCAEWSDGKGEGVTWIEMRCTFEADDGSLIHFEASKFVVWTDDHSRLCEAGKSITDASATIYGRFRTDSQKYAWLRKVSVTGFLSSMICGDSGHSEFDLYSAKAL